MGLLGTTTKQSYYSQSQSFTGTGSATGASGEFTLTIASFPTLPLLQSEIKVFINNREITKSNYTYNGTGGADVTVDNTYKIIFTTTQIDTEVQETNGSPKNGLVILVKETSSTEAFGTYRYISLKEIVNNFIVGYVGDGKLIKNVKRSDVLFHARRGIQEFAYDVSRVEKIQEVDVSSSLKIPMPQDYVNYVKISWIDGKGVEHLIMPARYSSKPSEPILQSADYTYLFNSDGGTLTGDSVQDTKFKSTSVTPSNPNSLQDYDAVDYGTSRYGLEPEVSTKNGVFIIDELNGTINFSSDLSEKTITIKYISDGVGTDAEMQIHKFTEEAMYKHLAYNILSTKQNIPEYVVSRYKKDRRAALRNAKIRLSNIKIEEIAQVMRGKSKHIKS